MKAASQLITWTKSWFDSKADEKDTQNKNEIKHLPAGVGTHDSRSLQPDGQESSSGSLDHERLIIKRSVQPRAPQQLSEQSEKFTIHKVPPEPHLLNRNALITPCICTVLPITSLRTTQPSLVLGRQQEPTRPTFRPLKVAVGFNQACSRAATSIKDRQTRAPSAYQ